MLGSTRIYVRSLLIHNVQFCTIILVIFKPCHLNQILLFLMVFSSQSTKPSQMVFLASPTISTIFWGLNKLNSTVHTSVYSKASNLRYECPHIFSTQEIVADSSGLNTLPNPALSARHSQVLMPNTCPTILLVENGFLCITKIDA